MFAMSVKLACGESVTIEPRLIGVPVAATPGLVPHCDVLVADVLALDVLVAVLVLAGVLELLELPLELELLLQPAAAIATAAARTIVLRADSTFGTGICALISPPLRW